MDSNIHIKFNRRGKTRLLCAPGVKARIGAHCLSIKRRAEGMGDSGAVYDITLDEHSVSAHGHVGTTDVRSRISNYNNDSLIRALAAEPGVNM